MECESAHARAPDDQRTTSNKKKRQQQASRYTNDKQQLTAFCFLFKTFIFKRHAKKKNREAAAVNSFCFVSVFNQYFIVQP